MSKEKTTISPWFKATLTAFISALLIINAWLFFTGKSSEKGESPSLKTHSTTSIITSLTDEENTWLREHPVILVAQDPAWAPIEFVDEYGNPSGMSNDYLNLIEQRLGITFERVKNMDWQEAYVKLKKWDIDMTTSVAATPDRSKYWAFTEPYMNIPIVIIAQSDVTYISDMNHLAGEKVAVVDGYIAGELIQQDFPEIQILKVNTVKQGLDLVQKGRALAFVDNMLVIDYYLSKHKSIDLKIVGETPYKNVQCMAVRKDWAVLAGILQKSLDSITEEERNQIYIKWAPLRYERRPDYKILWLVLPIFVIIFMGLILWNRKLLREIKYRKKAEHALVEGERHFRQLFEVATVPLCFFDKNGILIDYNNRFERTFGYTADDIPTLEEWGQQAYPDPDYRAWAIETWNASVHRAIKNKTDIEPTEYKVTCKNGELKRVLISGTFIGNDFLAVLTDLTELKNMEETLRYHDIILRNMGRIAKIGGWEFDPATGKGTWTEEVARIHDLDPEDETSVQQGLSFYRGDSRDRIERAVKEATETGKPYDMTLELITTKGVHKWVRAIADPLVENGRVVQVRGAFQDITMQKQAEDALRLAHERLRRFVDSNIIGVLIADPSGKVIEANDYFLNIIGFTRDELDNGVVDWRSITPPEWLPVDEKAIKELREKGTCTPYEKEYLRRDGIRVPIFLVDTMLPGPEEHIAAFALDLTDRKRAEKALKESETLFRNLFQRHSAVKLLIDPDNGNIIDANDAAVNFYGWPREQLIQMNIQDINTLPSEIVKQEIEKVRKDGKIYFEFRHRLADGSVRDVEVFSSKIESKGKDLLHSVIHDITERKRAEQALRESEENLKKSQKTARLGSWIYDLKDKIIWSDQLYEIYGVSRYNFIPTPESFVKLLHPDDRAGNQQWLKDCMSGKNPGEFIFRIILKDGTIRYISGRGELNYDEEGKPFQMSGTAQDITERKLVEADHERLMAAIEQVGESIIITDADGVIQYVNPAFEIVTGYSREEAIGQRPSILKSGDQDDRFYDELWKTITGGRTWKGRIVNRDKNGNLFTEAAIISPVYNASGKIVNYVAAKQDITEYLELEKQFQQAQKMESMGRLAGGVAHDYNNMLSVILGYTELAMLKIDANDPSHNDLQEIFNAAIRSRDITRQLLAFARKETITPEVLDLNETIEAMLKMLRRLIGEDINLVWLPGASLWPIEMDPSQLNQILANLCVNARDAIEDVGRISIETDNVSFDRDYCADHPGFIPGHFVLLAVSDNGSGMDNVTMGKIFEPFFTTKELGRGTGLGLATVHGIVKQNNGFINVYSELGNGTTFKIYLPRHVEKSVKDLKETVVEIPKGRGEIVLVVEDESSILSLAKKILDSLGYIVLTAKSADEAKRIAADYQGSINLLITDVVMPEMNGRELADQLQSLYPDIKCLFMSGYTADVIAHKGILEKGVHFIQKPFSRKDLAVKVRNALL